MADNKNEIVKTGRRKCSIAVAKVVVKVEFLLTAKH